jgi:hypothetical protein
VLLVPGRGAYLQLVGLRAPLAPGMSVPVTFQFEGEAGPFSADVTVPFGPPSAPVPRASAEVEGHE